jgi:predicted NUDIX family phosphoesterase
MLEKKNLEMDILVVSSGEINHIGLGFTPTTKEEVLELEKKGQYKLRLEMEEDKNYQQFLPYVVIKKGSKIFTYQRSKKGGENRLFDKWSVGVGGHVDYPDNIIRSTLRELEEEIDLKVIEDDLNFVGFINVEETPVDLFHLGIAIVVEVPDDFDISKGELDKITNRNFNNKKELKAKNEDFESWSKVFFTEYLDKIL